jgi:predicted PurR-regulated permease PerM
MGELARRTFVVTTVALAVVAGALALWHLKVLVALLLLSMIVASAIRPGVEALGRRRVPRGLGVALQYLGLLIVVGLVLWLIVPRAVTQVQHALDEDRLHRAAMHSSGFEHDLLVALERRLRDLPSGSQLVHPALTIGRTAVEAVVGIFFVFATAAYWIFEKQRAQGLVLRLVPRQHRRVVRETWDLIDAKLGAFIRGQLAMIALVSTVLSLGFWLIDLPYWLLIGVSAGIVEILPVIGPLLAGLTAVAAGLTVDWQHAAMAAGVVAAVRLVQDYVVGPRVLGHAVGLSPLIVLVTVSAVGLLFGGFYVLLSVPLAALLATIFEVWVLDKDPAEQEVPSVLFPSGDAERSTGVG